MSISTDQHRLQAQGRSAVCCILTVSDTRTESTDKGGSMIRQLLENAGHSVKAYAIVKDEPDDIEHQLNQWLLDPAIQVICTTGGTGIARRDTTIEIVQKLISKQIDGFGELFRMLSWDEVGSAAMLSRAVAGLAGETLIFAMPGSTNAVKLAMTRLIIPELPHLIWERRH